MTATTENPGCVTNQRVAAGDVNDVSMVSAIMQP